MVTKNNTNKVGEYTDKMNNLHGLVHQMLADFGFSPELYIVRVRTRSIDVEFDDEGAVLYFRDQCEIDYPEDIYVEYLRNGKRHVARVQYW